MEAEKKQPESGQPSVSEVMYQVGYADAKAFRNVFRKITGITPYEYSKKFNAAAVV